MRNILYCRNTVILLMPVLWFLFGQGCASSEKKPTKVSYQENAEANFKKGQEALKEEEYLEAIEYFQFVKNKFPYASYAITGEVDLLLAECYFGQKKYIEAADGYQLFVKLHPKHPKVPYSVLQIGVCHMKQMPDEWFFTPPAYELDQEETLLAVSHFEQYIRQYPNDEHIEKGREYLRQCKKMLASRSRYLMNFYWKRDRYRGVIFRADELLEKYAGLGFDEEALYRKAQACEKLKRYQEVKSIAERLLKEFPDGDFAKGAQKLLSTLPKASKQEAVSGS